jgi:hypothetical protein
VISADGGVLLLFVWAAGPKMHFFLHELAIPHVQKLLTIYSSLYGVPVLLPPTLHLSLKRMPYAA